LVARREQLSPSSREERSTKKFSLTFGRVTVNG